MMETKSGITEDLKGGVTILHVRGKLDAALSAAIEQKSSEMIQQGQNKLLLDMSEISYVNSAGLRMLLAVKKQMKALPGKFIVCGLRNEVFEVMKICGFDHVIEISKNEEEALRHFNNGNGNGNGSSDKPATH